MSIFYSLIKGAIKAVQDRNESNPEVKTADKSVFDKLNDRLGKTESEEIEMASFPDLMGKVNEVRHENEADPNVETADESVFNDMAMEIEALKAKLAEEEAKKKAALAEALENKHEAAAPIVKDIYKQTQAMTNSNGGSLGIRMNPDMGAPINTIRIPDSSMIRILEWSDISINLDGADSRFVLIDYNGQQGWVLDRYLNFN